MNRKMFYRQINIYNSVYITDITYQSQKLGKQQITIGPFIANHIVLFFHRKHDNFGHLTHW